MSIIERYFVIVGICYFAGLKELSKLKIFRRIRRKMIRGQYFEKSGKLLKVIAERKFERTLVNNGENWTFFILDEGESLLKHRNESRDSRRSPGVDGTLFSLVRRERILVNVYRAVSFEEIGLIVKHTSVAFRLSTT